MTQMTSSPDMLMGESHKRLGHLPQAPAFLDGPAIGNANRLAEKRQSERKVHFRNLRIDSRESKPAFCSLVLTHSHRGKKPARSFTACNPVAHAVEAEGGYSTEGFADSDEIRHLQVLLYLLWAAPEESSLTYQVCTDAKAIATSKEAYEGTIMVGPPWLRLLQNIARAWCPAARRDKQE